MALYYELGIRTQYDERDLMSVVEIFYYDQNGEEQECKEATNACFGITTCADQGVDLWSWLKEQVECKLKNAGISYKRIVFENDCGN